MFRYIVPVLMIALFAPAARAEDPLPKPETFDVAGHKGMVYAAPKPALGKPWLWYMPTLNGSIAFIGKKAYYEGFLNAGIAIVGYDLGEVRGAPGSTAKNLAFYKEMVKRGYSPKPIVLGQSRGGLVALGWGMRHPDKMQAFVGIYPVCNLDTWGMKNLPVTLADYEMTEADLRKRMKEFNPVDNLEPMIKAKVPIFVVQGDMDKAVPIKDNTLLLKERYEAGSGPITVKMIPGEGHQGTPSFYACPELIDFVIKQAGGRPQPSTQPAAQPATVQATR